MPTERFKSAEAYKNWNAYTHMHGIQTHLETAVVAGVPHKVRHTSRKKTRRADLVPLASLSGSKKKN